MDQWARERLREKTSRNDGSIHKTTTQTTQKKRTKSKKETMKKPNYNNKRVLKKTLTAKMLICDTFVGRKNAVIGPLVFNPLFSTSDLNHL